MQQDDSVQKDYMYLVFDYTSGLDGELGDMEEDLERWEKDILKILDCVTPNAMVRTAESISNEMDSATCWLLRCKSYLMYNYLNLEDVQRVNYKEHVDLFTIDRISMVNVAISLVS